MPECIHAEKVIIMFIQIADVKAVQADTRTLKRNENSSRLIINTRCPEIAQGVHAGDNIVILNNVIDALAGNRQKEIFEFFKAMVPYHFDKDTLHFTKKFKDAEKVAEKEQELVAFLKSGVTVFGWLSLNVKVEAKETDWEAQWGKVIAKTATHLTNAKMLEIYFSMAEGIDAATVLGIFSDVAAKKLAEDQAEAA